jgi:myosin-1
MGEKVTASNLLKGKKASYPRSVSHPFLGDYVRLRVNSEWRKIAKQDVSLVFADLVHKLSPSSGKVRDTQLMRSRLVGFRFIFR